MGLSQRLLEARSTCGSKVSYASEAVAAEVAEQVEAGLGEYRRAYACETCGYWHLTIASTRRQCMFCTDSALFLKDIYSTREEAQRTAEHLRREKRIQLYPYKCPHGSGWHLTKK